MDDDLDAYYGTNDDSHPVEGDGAEEDAKDSDEMYGDYHHQQQQQEGEEGDEDEDDAGDLYGDIKIQLSESPTAGDPLAALADSSNQSYPSNNATYGSGEDTGLGNRPAGSKVESATAATQAQNEKTTPTRHGPQKVYSIWIGGLTWWTTDLEIEEAVVKAVPTNKLIDVRFFEDRENGKSKGVAQLDFLDDESAKAAVKALKGSKFHGKECKAELAPDDKEKLQPGISLHGIRNSWSNANSALGLQGGDLSTGFRNAPGGFRQDNNGPGRVKANRPYPVKSQEWERQRAQPPLPPTVRPIRPPLPPSGPPLPSGPHHMGLQPRPSPFGAPGYIPPPLPVGSPYSFSPPLPTMPRATPKEETSSKRPSRSYSRSRSRSKSPRRTRRSPSRSASPKRRARSRDRNRDRDEKRRRR